MDIAPLILSYTLTSLPRIACIVGLQGPEDNLPGSELSDIGCSDKSDKMEIHYSAVELVTRSVALAAHTFLCLMQEGLMGLVVL